MNNKVGEKNKNKFNSEREIIEYKNSKEVLVLFEDGYKCTTQYANFRKGLVKN